MTQSEATRRSGIFGPRYGMVTAAIVALVSIVAFESMAISTAMPKAAIELDAVGSYGLAFSVLLTLQLLGNVVSGVLCDRYGPMPSIYLGQALFALGSTLCAVSASLVPFLLGRALSGLGAGLLVVALFVVVGRFYPGSMRARVFTAVSAAWVLPSLVGPLIAAWITTLWSWRGVFWIVVGPVLLAATAIYRHRSALVATEVGPASRDRRAHVRAAWLGLAIALGAGGLQWGTHELRLTWSAQTATGLAGLLVVAVAAPALLPAGTFIVRRGVPAIILARLAMPAAYIGAATYLPLMLVRDRGHSLSTGGLLLSVGALGWAAGSWVQGLDRMDGRRHRLVAQGGASLSLGLLAMALVAWRGLPAWYLPLPVVCAGLGMGMATSSLNVLALDLTDARDHGDVSTALTISDVLGSVLGIAAASAVHALSAAFRWPTGAADTVSWTGLAAVAAVVIVAGTRILHRPST